jgi:hypothetical protein
LIDPMILWIVSSSLGMPGRCQPPKVRTIGTWGDNSVSSCRSYSRAKGPGTSAGTFPIALILYGYDPRGPGFWRRYQGVLWGRRDPRDPLAYGLAALVGTPILAAMSIHCFSRAMFSS